MTNARNDITATTEAMAKDYVDRKLTEHARVAVENDTHGASADTITPTIIIPTERLHGTEVVDEALATTISEYCNLTGTSLSEEKNVLHILTNMLFAHRTMMIGDDASATKRYLADYETLNATIRENIHVEFNRNPDNFNEYLQDGFHAMLWHDVKSFDAYINSSDKFGLFTAFRKTVCDIIAERKIDMEIRDITAYRPLDVEMQRYGNDALIQCWIAPKQQDNHNTEGMQLAAEVRLLATGFENINDIDEDDEITGALDSLFTSQGYDLHSCLKHSTDRAFPASLKQEVSEMTGQITRIAFITACAYISVADLDATMRGVTDALIIPAEAGNNTVVPIGIFDPVTGSGSLFEIELERDWIVPLTPGILGSFFGGVHVDEDGMSGAYGYSPSHVYGDMGLLAQIYTVKLPVN